MPTQQEWDKIAKNKEMSISVGACLHDAVAISTAKLGKEKASLVTREDYQQEVEFWLDWLLELSQKKKEYLSIPVLEEEIIPIKEEPMDGVKQWEAKKREIDDLKVEEEQGKNLPF